VNPLRPLFIWRDEFGRRTVRPDSGRNALPFWRCALGFEYKSRMAILVVLFPNGGDLVDGDVAQVIVIVFQVEHAALDFDNFAAEARRASAKHVDFAIDHVG
jgi:hypothetical protein